jgi:hypothetical protein
MFNGLSEFFVNLVDGYCQGYSAIAKIRLLGCEP